MNNLQAGQSPLAPYGEQMAKAAVNSAHLAPVPPSSLLETTIQRLHGGHDIVQRLEGVANRIYGMAPDPANVTAPADCHSASVNQLLDGLLDRLHSVANRLEQVG